MLKIFYIVRRLKVAFYVTLFSLAMICNSALFANPILLEQSNVVRKSGEIEIGFNIAYQYLFADLDSEYELLTHKGYNNFYFLYGVSEYLETQILIPYVWINKKTISKSSGFAVRSTSADGFGDLNGKIKFVISDRSKIVGSAFVLEMDFPTGDELSGLGEGYNVNPKFVIGKDVKSVKFDANIGYKVTGSYQQYNPGNIYNYGLTTTLTHGMWDFLVEIFGEHFGNSEYKHQINTDTKGDNWNIMPGFVYYGDLFKIQTGLNFSCGDKKDRKYDVEGILNISIGINPTLVKGRN